MAVLLAKEPSKQETVCDLHGDLTNLSWVLQDRTKAEQLYDRLSRTLFAESLLTDAKRFLEGHNGSECCVDLDRAYWFFVHSWCARNGTSGSKRMSFQLAVRWTSGGGSPTIRFRNAIESIPAWHERLRNVVILNRNAFDVIPRIPDERGVAVYCDPPYLHSTRTGDGDGGYRHDFDELPGFLAADDDHSHLAQSLQRFCRARVVVSYYAHPRLATLYPPDRWARVSCAITKNLRASCKRGMERKEAPEALLLNGPSLM